MSHTEQTAKVVTPNPQVGDLVRKQDAHFRKLIKVRIAVTEKEKQKAKKEIAKELQGKLKQEGETHKKSVEQQKTEAEFKPAYDTRIEILDRAVQQIERMAPFGEKEKAELLKMRSDAESKATQIPPDWKGAVAELKKAKIAEAYNKANGDAIRREGERKDHTILGEAMTKFLDLRTKFRESPMSVDAMNKIGNAMNKTYGILLADHPDKNEAKQVAVDALKKIAEFDKQIDEDVKKSNAEYNKYKQRSTMFLGIKMLENIGPEYLGDFGDAEIDDLKRRHQAADADAAFGDYETANKRLDQLSEECKRLRSEAESAKKARREDLEKAQKRIPAILSELDKLIQNPTIVPAPLLEQAKSLHKSLGDLATVDDSNEGANLQQINQLEGEAESVLDRVATGPEFIKTKNKLVKEVEVKKKWVHAAIDVLESELKRHPEIEDEVRADALEPFDEEFAAIDDAWIKKANAAYDLVSLDQDGTLEALYTLRDKVLAAGSPAGIEALADKKALEAARAKLSKQLDELQPLIEKSVGLMPVDGLALAGEAERARVLLESGKLPAKLDEVGNALEQQASKLRGLVNLAEKQAAKDREKILQRCGEADKTLVELGKEIGEKPGGSDRRKAYEQMLTTLQGQSVTIKKLAATDDMKVLADALADAVKLTSDTEKMEEGWHRGLIDKLFKSDDPNTMDYARKQLDQAEKSYKSFSDVDYVMISHDDIGEKIEAAKKALGTEDPPKTMEKVTEIEKAIETMKTKAKDGKQKYEEIKKLCEQATGIIKSGMLDKKTEFETHAPDLVKELEQEINTLQANGKFEDGYKQAKTDAKAMIKRLQDMAKAPKNIAGVSATMYEGQGKAKATAEKKELQEKQFEGEAKALRTELVHAKNSGTPAKEIEKLTKELEFVTKEVAGKQKDYAGAIKRVGQIRSTVAGFADAPEGLKITARKKLRPANQAYMKAARRFNRLLVNMGKEIAKYDLTDDTNAVNAERVAIITRELTSIAAIFNPLTFNAVVKKMTAPGDQPKDLGPKRKAREKGLRASRRIVKRMHKDQRLRVLIKNPFEPNMKKTLSQLNLALLDLEHNMTVSV